MNLNTRLIAARVLIQVHQGKPLNDALTTVMAAYPNMSAADRSFVQELSYGVLRWYSQLTYLTTQFLKKPLKKRDQDIQQLILIGLYQLGYLQQPDYAVINETANAIKLTKKPWAVGLVNAILRQAQRQGKAGLTTTIANASDPAIIAAHPCWLLEVIDKAWPMQRESIIQANNTKPPLTLRVNRLQLSRDQYLEKLAEKNIEATKQQHCDDGVIIQQSISIAQLPGYQQGQFAVQDGAAQLAVSLLALEDAKNVLDACAAPGGKTAHILTMAPKTTQCMAWDKQPARLAVVKENLQRLQLWDENRITLHVQDATVPTVPKQLFDRILIDAPCSATGIIRRHPDIKWHRQPEQIATLATTQLQLLLTLWPWLAPGGRLVYATCSILPQENGDVIQQFLQQTDDASALPIDVTRGVAQFVGRQVLPGMDDMDGFYYAVLVKLG